MKIWQKLIQTPATLTLDQERSNLPEHVQKRAHARNAHAHVFFPRDMIGRAI